MTTEAIAVGGQGLAVVSMSHPRPAIPQATIADRGPMPRRNAVKLGAARSAVNVAVVSAITDHAHAYKPDARSTLIQASAASAQGSLIPHTGLLFGTGQR